MVHGLQDRASTLSLEEMETATSSSPIAKYYTNLDEGRGEPSEASGANSPRHFFCQFDPVTKKDRLLMLMFDSQGNSTLNEMSRLDVLRVTQEAARVPREAESFSAFGKPLHVSPLQPSQPSAADSGTSVCDVQVRVRYSRVLGCSTL